MSVDLSQRFADEMGALLGPDFPTDLALAVSGGGDSMAMLHLAAGWARVYGVTLWVATVDHGLRDGSAAEAAMVADECEGLGLHHDTLVWTGWDGSGNLQDAARQARLELLQGWRGKCAYVLMGHTQDDQAETVLMRLLRGSGVDGLSGIAAVRQTRGLAIVRPLLGVSRAALRHYCTTLKIPFVDDPSNEDKRFERVRIRRLIQEEGFDAATLAKTATQMARARQVLETSAQEAMSKLKASDFKDGGYVALERDGLAHIPPETLLRVIAAALCCVGQNAYRPRLSALEEAIDTVQSGGTTTLHGCVLTALNDKVVICRELQAVAGRCSTKEVWDGRWAMQGPHAPDLEVGALGDAVAECPNWRDTGHPRVALRASPAIWNQNRLIAAPMAGFTAGWTARIDVN